MKWSPNIPGTEVNRVAFLTKAILARKDAVAAAPSVRNPLIQSLAADRVLSLHQLGVVFSLSAQTIHKVLRPAGLSGSGNHERQFDPLALELLLTCAKCYWARTHPTEDTLNLLTEHCSGKLAERLAGVPYREWCRAKRRMTDPVEIVEVV